MTVHVLLAAFGRPEETRATLACLAAQDEPVNVTLVDHSPDHSVAPVVAATFPGLDVLFASSRLWWAGAMEVGLRRILRSCGDDDSVLLQNNDVTFAPDHVRILRLASEGLGDGVVGSLACDRNDPGRIVHQGARIDWRRQTIDEPDPAGLNLATLPDLLPADALSGRGTLYPVKVLRRSGTLRPRLLPHYLADYELAVRAHSKGAPLAVASKAIVLMDAEPSGLKPGASFWRSLWDRRSRSNARDFLLFFSMAGPIRLRWTAGPRLAFRFARRRLGKPQTAAHAPQG